MAAYLRGEDWRDDIATAYDELFRRLRPVLSELPPAPLHGDWQTNNLFFDGDRLSSIIDFHQADYAPRLLDLAVAVERNCFFWNRISAGEDDAHDLDHARLLIESYHEVAPLTEAERAAFTDVLAACQFEYGISFLDYYWGDRARPRQGRLGLAHVRDRARTLVAERRRPARASRLDQVCAGLAWPSRARSARRSAAGRYPSAHGARRSRRGRCHRPQLRGHLVRDRRLPDRGRAGDHEHLDQRGGRLAPSSASNGRALTSDSSTSAAGSESQTMPPPAHRWISPAAIANVRMVSPSSRSPFG